MLAGLLAHLACGLGGGFFIAVGGKTGHGQYDEQGKITTIAHDEHLFT